jgi:hypothetical protein
MLWDTARRLVRRATALSGFAAIAMTPSFAGAQEETRPSLLQVEVRDSIGLPLPDATMEVFTLLERGIVWEWVRVDPGVLPPGINLVRFSHPGYRSSVLSVPLRKGSVVSLRVRLDTERDTSPPRPGTASAYEVRAIGLAIEGRAKNDIIGLRRVIPAADIAANTDAHTLGALMRRTKNTNLNILPATGGTFRVLSHGRGGGSTCPMQVMVNGDRRRFLPFATFDRLFGPEDMEAIEIFPEGHAVPFAYQAQRSSCGLLVVWMKNP